MSDTAEVRRKRLAHRSRYRGVKESDLLFGQFADAHLPTLEGEQLDRYEALVAENDEDVLAWVDGRQPVPARHDNAVFALLRRFEPTA